MKPAQPKNKKAPISAKPTQKKRKYSPLEIGIPIGICVLTFICFWHTLSNEFLYWDDNQFILNNIHIRRFTWENTKYLFSNEFGANWQPFTMLSYSLNYFFSKYNPFGYFFTNVLLHSANTALVFLVIRNLMNLFQKNAKPTQALIISGIVSLWFGIHPMHVESVAWLFERKDVLYTFFYLLGLFTYLHYLKNKKLISLVLVFALFAFSCMSKPMAVMFPASLVLIDFLLGRKFETKGWLEKIPFFLLSLTIGILTLHTQKEAHALDLTFPFIDRFFIACYSFLAYIFKLFFPFHLSGFYPYPMSPGEHLPGYFYIMPLIAILLTAGPLFYTYKKNKTWFRVVVFGLGVYLVNIILVLQFLSVGDAIISDRYSYLSYVGLFFILAYFMNEVIERNTKAIRYAMIAVGISFTGFLGYLCFERTYAWSNTEAMLGDVINKYPEKVPQAYRFLGIYYAKNNRLNDAYNCYDILINKTHEAGPMDYGNMGRVYMSMNKIKEAVKYFSISIKLDSTLIMSYLNLGEICADTGNYTAAMRYYQKAKSIYPYDESLNFQISLAHVATKQFAEAIKDYNILVEMNPDEAKYYYNRGIAEYSTGDKDAATDDFKRTLSMPVTPQDVQFHMDANSAENLSIIYKEKGDLKTSGEYAEAAQKLGYR